jgi:hypothetical protein
VQATLALSLLPATLRRRSPFSLAAGHRLGQLGGSAPAGLGVDCHRAKEVVSLTVTVDARQCLDQLVPRSVGRLPQITLCPRAHVGYRLGKSSPRRIVLGDGLIEQLSQAVTLGSEGSDMQVPVVPVTLVLGIPVGNRFGLQLGACSIHRVGLDEHGLTGFAQCHLRVRGSVSVDNLVQVVNTLHAQPGPTLTAMSGGLGVLSRAWITVEASMPLGWRLMALVRQTDSDDWLATAAGPLDGQTVHGRGAQPERALRRLADELRRIRGSVTG